MRSTPDILRALDIAITGAALTNGQYPDNAALVPVHELALSDTSVLKTGVQSGVPLIVLSHITPAAHARLRQTGVQQTVEHLTGELRRNLAMHIAGLRNPNKIT